MKIILTEGQAGRLVEKEIDGAASGSPGINYSDKIDGNSPEIKRLVGKMKTMYKVLKKGSGKVTTRQNAPFMVTYELPPIEEVEFNFYMSRDNGVICEIFTLPYGKRQKIKFAITNFDEFPDIAEEYSMEEFANSIHGVLFSGCVQKRFKNFGIKIW
jgi:hypothetical protein